MFGALAMLEIAAEFRTLQPTIGDATEDALHQLKISARHTMSILRQDPERKERDRLDSQRRRDAFRAANPPKKRGRKPKPRCDSCGLILPTDARRTRPTWCKCASGVR